MLSLRKMISLMVIDLKMWLRQPKLIVMSILPLLIISLLVGFFLARVELMPVGIVMEDNDPSALRLKDFLMNLKSGTGAEWFVVVDEGNEATKKNFESGKILGMIVIPANLSSKLNSGGVASIPIHINNINDDVTKNFVQRMQNACNYFNDNLTVGEKTLHVPRVRFMGNVPVDLEFIKYIAASVLGLTVLIASGMAGVFSIAREFEEGTIRELIMASSLANVIGGKLLSTIGQTTVVFLFVLLEQWVVFGFLPRNILMQLFMLLWGILFFAGVGVFLASKIKQVLPAGIAIIILGIGGWWVGGGLAPSEAWTGVMRTIADLSPTTYFFQMFINTSLPGEISGYLIARNLLITGVFGLIMMVVAFKIFLREVKSI